MRNKFMVDKTTGLEFRRMIKAGLIGLCVCGGVGDALASGADTVEAADSIAGGELQEVVVTAPETMKIGNKTVFTPDRKLLEISNSSVQLLSGLQIPDLIVNIVTGQISLLGDGKLSLRINGRPASQADVAAINSKDILKVEYIDNPGVRYGDATGVLDISVRRRDSGYGAFANVMQSVNRGWADYTASLKYNTGGSEWSFDYKSNPIWNMDCFRNNEELIRLYDGTQVERTERGIKVPNRMVTHRAALQYSYARGRDFLFNVQGRVFRTNDHYKSNGDITTVIGQKVISGFEAEENPVKSWQGDLDLYMHKKLNDKHMIFVNLVPTVIDSHTERIYRTELINLDNSTESRGYGLLGEGILESKIGKGTLSTGLRSNTSWTRTTVYNPVGEKSREVAGLHSVFGQWAHNTSQFQYEAGVSLAYYGACHPVEKNYFALNPRLFAKYRVNGNFAVALYGEVKTVTPEINEINTTVQQLDVFQWSQGNSSLKPYQQYNGKVEFEGRWRSINGKVTVSDIYSHDPIMTAKSYRDGRIFSEPYNYGSHNHFEVKGQVRMPLIPNWVNLSLEGGWHTMESRGVDYTHRYSQPFVNAQLMLMKNHWLAMIRYNNSYNRLWGEMVTSANQNLTIFALGYTYRSATFLAAFVNPIGNVVVKSRDMSALASFDRTYQASGSHQLACIGVIFNFHHGKSRSASQKKLQNDQKYQIINNVKK